MMVIGIEKLAIEWLKSTIERITAIFNKEKQMKHNKKRRPLFFTNA